MTTLTRPETSHTWQREGDLRILLSLLNKSDYTATLGDIEWAWDALSDDYCAGWLNVDSFNETEQLEMLLSKLVIQD